MHRFIAAGVLLPSNLHGEGDTLVIPVMKWFLGKLGNAASVLSIITRTMCHRKRVYSTALEVPIYIYNSIIKHHRLSH